MYDINPHKARVDIFNIDPVDTGLIAQRQSQEFAKQQNKQKQAQGNEDDVYNSLNSLNKLAVLDRERPMFAERQAALYGNVKKNIEKIRNGDTNALLGFQQELGAILTDAEQSKNTREKIESVSKTMQTDGFEKYRPESLEYLTDYVTNPQYNGTYNFDPSNLKQNSNYNERVIKELAPHAQRMAKDSPLTKVFTKQQAEGLIADDLADPVIFEQAAYDFNKSKDKLGAKTPVEFYQKKYAPSLIVNDTKEAYYTGFSGNKDTRPKVNGTYTDAGNGSGEFQFEYTNTTDNPYLTIKDPKTGGALEIKPIKVVFGGKTPVLQATTKAYKNADDEDVPAKTMTLDYNYVSDVMHNKFGIKNIYDIKEGNEPSHVTVKRNDVSKKGKVSEVERKTKDGRVAIFNADTKEFIRWK